MAIRSTKYTFSGRYKDQTNDKTVDNVYKKPIRPRQKLDESRPLSSNTSMNMSKSNTKLYTARSYLRKTPPSYKKQQLRDHSDPAGRRYFKNNYLRKERTIFR
jgi:hypothetical protein